MRDARLALMAAVLAGLGSIMSEVGAAMMVGGNIATSSGNDTRTLTTAIVQETRIGNYATAMAFSLILMGIVFAIVLVLTRAQQGRQGRWLRS
jgi:tungstate transport system permease protein